MRKEEVGGGEKDHLQSFPPLKLKAKLSILYARRMSISSLSRVDDSDENLRIFRNSFLDDFQSIFHFDPQWTRFSS